MKQESAEKPTERFAYPLSPSRAQAANEQGDTDLSRPYRVCSSGQPGRGRMPGGGEPAGL
jgi:hypothetical protein